MKVISVGEKHPHPQSRHSARHVQQIPTERVSGMRKNLAPVRTPASSAGPLVAETFQVHLSIKRLGFVLFYLFNFGF